MKKVIACMLVLVLVLSGCASSELPEKPSSPEPKFAQEESASSNSTKPEDTAKTDAAGSASAGGQDSAASAESSETAAEESSPAPETQVGKDGMYRVITLIVVSDGVESTQDVSNENLFLTVEGGSATYWNNGYIIDSFFDPETGRTEVNGEPGTLYFEGDTVTLVDDTDGYTYVFRRLTPEEQAAAEELIASGGSPAEESPYGAPVSPDQLEVKAEYLWDMNYGYYGYILVVDSKLSESRQLTLEARACDAAGNVLAEDYAFRSVVAPGEEIAFSVNFITDVQPDHVDYTIYQENPWGLVSIGQQIGLTADYIDDQVTIEAVNNSGMDTIWMEVLAVFFDEQGNFAHAEYGYFNELVAGSHNVTSIYSWGTHYDSVSCYVYAYGDGTVTTPIDPFSQIQVVAEYEEVSTYYINRAAILKNISDQSYEIRARYILRDENGVAVDTTYDTIDILAPGETTCFYTSKSTPEGINIASKELMLTISVKDYYLPIIGDLSYTVEEDGYVLNLSVTNNSAKTAEFVYATVLFFDAENNLVSVNGAYVTDTDSEIKAGATETAEIWCPSAGYDHYEIYFDGRASKD